MHKLRERGGRIGINQIFTLFFFRQWNVLRRNLFYSSLRNWFDVSHSVDILNAKRIMTKMGRIEEATTSSCYTAFYMHFIIIIIYFSRLSCEPLLLFPSASLHEIWLTVEEFYFCQCKRRFFMLDCMLILCGLKNFLRINCCWFNF